MRIPADGWIALVILLFCGVCWTNLLATEGAGAFVKTTTLPTALVAVLALLALLLFGGSFRRSAVVAEPDRASATEEADGGGSESGAAGLVRVAVLLAWTVTYVLALPWFGYVVSSVVFLFGAGVVYGDRRWFRMLLTAFALPLTLLLFFEKVMIVLLPSGRLFG